MLEKEEVKLLSSDPYFQQRTKLFISEIGEGGPTCLWGGDILMVQVENKYGAHATNKECIAHILGIVKKPALFLIDRQSDL